VNFNKLIYFKNCNATLLNLYKNSYFLRLIARQAKKSVFFDKFLLRHLIFKNNVNQKRYIQGNTLNKLYRTFTISGKKIKAYNAIMNSFFKVYSVINLEVYNEVSKNYLYFKEFLFNKELNREFNSALAIVN
jgi:hypothetical protein